MSPQTERLSNVAPAPATPAEGKNLAPRRPRNILFVDDEVRVLDAIRRSMRDADPNLSLSFVNSVDQALAAMATMQIDAVITDVTMPVRDGFDLLHAMSTSDELRHIPVIVLTGLADGEMKRRALDAGAFDLIAKPVSREDLIARLRNVLRTKDYEDSLTLLNATLEKQVADRTRDLEASRTELLLCLAMAGECRDGDTGRHVIRVARYARAIARHLKLPESDIEMLYKTSPLHDIGKLGVPDSILLKSGPLTPEERATMQAHAEIGCKILTTPAALAKILQDRSDEAPFAANPLLVQAASIALSHHERWDGTGYPNKLAGNDIPLFARVVAVADVYDALTTRRPYKEAMPHAAALKILYESSGTHFDPFLIEALKAIELEFDRIRTHWSDDADHQSHSLAAIVGGFPEGVAA